MPTYKEIANIIIEKTTIEKKYIGGIEQFKIDYSYGEDKRHQEDDELFSVAFMNIENSEISYLEEKGLAFDRFNNVSNDFVIVYRYGDSSWKVEWLEENAAFAWHKRCKPEQKDKAQKILELTMDRIAELQNMGKNPFEVIKT